jgi:hypothetical protein
LSSVFCQRTGAFVRKPDERETLCVASRRESFNADDSQKFRLQPSRYPVELQAPGTGIHSNLRCSL